MCEGAIHLEGGPLTRNIEGVILSPSLAFYHKKSYVSRPFDLWVHFSRWQLGQFKIRELQLYKELNFLLTQSLSRKVDPKVGIFVEVKQTV